ncbi:hypothetical protein L7F22_047270 [Adiantum nelumboides]|nr:hypothetical protein [Adiantum nelumboides]
MNNEFTRAHKQGVDLWSKVPIQLASLHPDCDKDGESCRKRWGRIYDSYKKGKLYLSVSGNDKKISCQWFDVVDQYMSDCATVTIDAFTSAPTLGEDVAETNEDMSTLPDEEDDGKGEMKATKGESLSTMQSSKNKATPNR